MPASRLDCTGGIGVAHQSRGGRDTAGALQRSARRQGLSFKASARLVNKSKLMQRRSGTYAASSSTSPIRLPSEFLGSKSLGSKRLPFGSLCWRRPLHSVRSCTAETRRAGLVNRSRACRLSVDMKIVEVPGEGEGNAASSHGTPLNGEGLLHSPWNRMRANGQAASEHSEGPISESLHINGHVLHPLHQPHTGYSLSYDQDISSFHAASNGHVHELQPSASTQSLPPVESSHEKARGSEQNLRAEVRKLQEELERIKVSR